MFKLSSSTIMRSALSLLMLLQLTQGKTGHSTAADDSEFLNPSWEKPDMWSVHKRRERERMIAQGETLREICNCPPAPVCETPPSPPEDSAEEIPLHKHVIPVDVNNQLAMVFYKKFALRLLDEVHLRRDVDSDYLVRNVQLKITKHQLDQLKTAENARQVDAVIASVIEQSGKMTFYQMTQSVCFDMLSVYQKLANSVFFLYLLMPTLYIVGSYLFVVLLSRWLGINRWILGMILIVGISYCMSYVDCNRKLEAEAMARFSFSNGRIPCQENYSGWFDYLNPLNLFSESSERKCFRQLREVHRVHVGFCSPLQVSVQMLASLQMEYFGVTFDKIIDVFGQTNWIGKGLIICLVILFAKYGLKYGLQSSAHVISSINTGRRAIAGHGPVPVAAVEGAQPIAPVIQPINVNVNLTHGDSLLLNRLDEIIARPVQASAIPAIEDASKTNTNKRDDGSGDGPVGNKATGEQTTINNSSGSNVEEVNEQDSELEPVESTSDLSLKKSQTVDQREEKKHV